MRKIDALSKDGKKVALLKEDCNGNWRVFFWSTRQTFRNMREEQAKALVQGIVNESEADANYTPQITFQER